MNIANKKWHDHEFEMILAAYVNMYRAELEGKPVVKARIIDELTELTGHPSGSVSYMFRNVSAVMEELGLPFVQAFKPAYHYNKNLPKFVVQYIDNHQLADFLANAEAVTNGSPDDLPYVPAPKKNDDIEAVDSRARGFFYKHNPADRDLKLRALGEAGEKFVLDAERIRLLKEGKPSLADKVRWVAKECGDGLGYDILSFSIKGDERFLEIKTTNGHLKTPFWISANELRVSEENTNKFRLIRIYDFARHPKAFKLKPPLSDHVRLVVSQYRATF